MDRISHVSMHCSDKVSKSVRVTYRPFTAIVGVEQAHS